MDIKISNENKVLYGWEHFDSHPMKHFQQFTSNKFKDKNFSYILCQILNKPGQLCDLK